MENSYMNPFFPSFPQLFIGIIFIVFFCLNCKSDAASPSNNQIEKENDSIDFLEKSKLPFEILSAKTSAGKAFNANDKTVLSYEIDLVNTYRKSIFISKIEAIDFKSNEVLASFDSSYLLIHLLRPGVRSFDEVLEIKTSAFGVANLWYELEDNKIPEKIFHRIHFKLRDRNGDFQEISTDVNLIDFPETTKLTIGLPFKNGNWFYIANAHRDARLLTEGNPSFPQRFAIDWAAITDNYTFEIDDSKSIETYKTYNQDLLAVSDAKVVFIKDSIPENDPFSSEMAVPITRETVAGNYIVLDIGNEIYAFYAHLIPGSATVKLGDHVKKGDVIGKLGNSGNSTGPHLHFHLETKSKYPLGGEGIPFVFEKFTQLATYNDMEIDSILSISQIPLPLNHKPITRSLQLPVGNGVVSF